MRRPSIQAILTAAVVAVSAGFVLTRLEPSLLFANTTPSGGDMGAHVWAPAYLRDHLLPRFRLTGWTPDWYAGFPAFTFYFPLPSLLIVLLDLLVPYGVAFKLVSVLGAVTLPIAAYAFGRLSGLRFPGPPLLAVAVLPFLFDTSFTIYGGNIPSLLAGEFAFSLGLSLALVFLGLLVRGLETGRHRGLAAVLLALTVLSHAIPALFAIGVGFVLLILRLDRYRLRYVATVMLVAGMLTAFWALPLVYRLPFTNDLGWVKITEYLRTLFPAHVRWILPLAAAGLIGAIGMRLHSGVAIAAMGMLAGIAFVVAPEGRIWNARLLPFWFLCLYLLAGVGVSEVGRALGGVFARDPDRPARWPALATPVIALVATLAVVGGPLRTLPSWLPVRPGQASFVPNWVRWNFSGYEQKDAYPEYRALIETMGRLPCGRAMWEYDRRMLDRYGTPMALMLLPYWTKGCIGSMEGLFFESSPTTPFHFINQSELSAQPSRPQRDLPYPDLSVAMGVRHLQLLGVRYYLAFSPEALAQAHVDPNLIPVASSGPWEVFEVADSSLVSPLFYEPVVVNGIGNSQQKWLPMALPFYMNPESWEVLLAGAGPQGWARVDPDDPIPRLPVRPAEITRIRSSDNRIAFEVDRPGSPVLVKASYFPNWKVRGADGPWRVAPNLMVVTATARTVELYYGYTPVDIAGWLLTLFGLVGVVLLSRRALQFPEPPGVERFRRFAAITTLVTAIDFGILLFLRLQFGVPLLVANAVSISVAATASYLLHRSITFGDDPHIRWVREPSTFVAVTAAAGLIDLVVLGAAAGVLDSTSVVPLLAAKSLAVAAAGALRVTAYRRRLFVAVREEQATPALRPQPPGELRLSVVIPAFNEGSRIAKTIGRTRAALAEVAANGLEIVVVDDGSDDDTAERARAAGADRVIVLAKNRGKGAAVRAGMSAARGRVVAFIDADLSYPPEQIATLLEQVETGWDVVVGSRKHVKTTTLVTAGRMRELSGRLFNLLTRALLLGQYRDTQCGIKAFRSDVAKLLFSKSRLDRFAFDVELFHLAERYRLSLAEVPVTVLHTDASTVRLAVDAARMVGDTFRIRRWAGEGQYDLSLSEQSLLPGRSPRLDGPNAGQQGALASANPASQARPEMVLTARPEVAPLPEVRALPTERRKVGDAPGAPLAMGAMIAVWIVIFGYLGWIKHSRFATLSFDTGIWDQAIWLLSRFKDPFITVRGLNFFGHHANPTLLLMVPFYWLGSGPIFLVLLQTLAQAGGAVAIYRVAYRRLSDRWLAVGLAAALLLHPSWQWQVWWGFHPEVLGAVALIFAYWAALTGRWRWFAVSAIVAAGSKEELALVVAMLGLFVALRFNKRVGFATFGLSAGWFFVATELIMPGINNGMRPWYYGFFGEFGSTPLQIVWNTLAHPIRTLGILLRGDRLAYLWMMMAPTALLPIVRPDVLLIGIPILAMNLLSSIGYHRDIRFQYSAVVVAIIIIGTVEAIGLIGRRNAGSRRLLVGIVVAASLAATVAWGPSPISARFQGSWPAGDDPRAPARREAVEVVPQDAPVSATYYLVPHLTHRVKIYDFPAPWTPSNWGLQGENLHDPAQVQWIAVDRTRLGEEASALLDRLLAEEFDAQFERDGIVVAKRVRSPDRAGLDGPVLSFSRNRRYPFRA